MSAQCLYCKVVIGGNHQEGCPMFKFNKAETRSTKIKNIKRSNEIKDIKNTNTSLPRWPKDMNWFQKFLCLYGYHKWESRWSGPMSVYPGMKLRSQCGRCGTLK